MDTEVRKEEHMRQAALTRFLHRFMPVAVLAAGMTVLMGGPAAAQPEAEYRLGTGDRVKVIVFGHADLSGEFGIDGHGRLSLPLIQAIEAAGLTARQLERVITNKLRPDYLKNPRVSVEILSYRPFYIIGEVKNPGSYPYVNGMTVINAVALAGGYTYRAKTSEITITRADDAAKDKLPVDAGTLVRPGDVIEVPERFF
jgi:polysaccharide export outer membrane protein